MPFVNAAAFTLVEMLVVLAIIGVMAAMILPNLGKLTQSHAMTTASRQLLDDVAYARQRAINDHTTVYMIFVPGQFWADPNFNQIVNSGSKEQLTNLAGGQFTSYALFSERSIGDQPGNYRARYLTDWRDLPEGVLIPTNKFAPSNIVETLADVYDTTRFYKVAGFSRKLFPFPPAELTNNVAPAMISLPYIGFDSQGRLVSGQDEYIPLASGSIFYPRDAADRPKVGPEVPDVVLKQYREATRTNFNLVHIDWLTGRAKIQKLELK